MLLLTSLLPLLATFAVAEQLSEGASSCVSQAIEATGCSSDDSRCICSSDLFQTTHQDCIATNLDEDEVDSAVAFAEEFCDSVSHIEVREAEPERPSGYGKPSYKKKGKKHRKHKKHGKKHRKHKKKYGKGIHYKGNKKQPWWKRPWYSQPKKDGKPRYPVGKKPSYGGGKKHDNQPWWKKPWNSYKPKYGKKPKHPKKPHYPKKPHHGKPKHPKPHHPKPPKYPGKDKPTPPVYQPPTPTKTPCTTTTPPPTGYPTQPPTYYTSKPVQTVY